MINYILYNKLLVIINLLRYETNFFGENNVLKDLFSIFHFIPEYYLFFIMLVFSNVVFSNSDLRDISEEEEEQPALPDDEEHFNEQDLGEFTEALLLYFCLDL